MKEEHKAVKEESDARMRRMNVRNDARLKEEHKTDSRLKERWNIIGWRNAIEKDSEEAAVVQWNHACFGVRRVSKRTGSNPVHGPSVGAYCSCGKAEGTVTHTVRKLRRLTSSVGQLYGGTPAAVRWVRST
ncbi:hypothetical protein E2C01_042975 [Portunus trituberculatus]|uniref:Uncharacterized protein n=1 Tax=Portunus trituberculatus TaxID=210409 RepID=A0A5B7FN96_PORTR|nr:hypothetical protein [Portunus trituberculatus]